MCSAPDAEGDGDLTVTVKVVRLLEGRDFRPQDVQGLGLRAAAAAELPKLEFALPDGQTPGQYVVCIVCPHAGGTRQAVQFVWPGAMAGVDGGALLRGACAQKPKLWRRHRRVGGPNGRADWAAALLDDDICRQTVGRDSAGNRVEARQSWLPVLTQDQSGCCVGVTSIRKGDGGGKGRTTMLGQNGQGVVNPARAFRPAESGSAATWPQRRQQLMEVQPAWGEAVRRSTLLKLRTAQVQVQLGLGDVEQALETLAAFSRAPSLYEYAAAFSTTLNADAVYAHRDRSKQGRELVEMEALYNISVSVEDVERVGLGSHAPGKEPARHPQSSPEGLLCLLNHGVLLESMPDQDIAFVDLREIWHFVVRSSDPGRLRGHWSTAQPVISVADHRNGFTLPEAVRNRRAQERVEARRKGGAAVAVLRRAQVAELLALQVADA